MSRVAPRELNSMTRERAASGGSRAAAIFLCPRDRHSLASRVADTKCRAFLQPYSTIAHVSFKCEWVAVNRPYVAHWRRSYFGQGADQHERSGPSSKPGEAVEGAPVRYGQCQFCVQALKPAASPPRWLQTGSSCADFGQGAGQHERIGRRACFTHEHFLRLVTECIIPFYRFIGCYFAF